MKPTRDEVLSDFLDAVRSNKDAVREFCARYPEYREDICECAIFSAVLGDLESDETQQEGQRGEEADPGFEMASSRLRMLLLQALEPERTITSTLYRHGILRLLRTLNILPGSAADRLGIGVSVLTKLDRRLVDVATIPERLILALAELLQREVDEVRAYLRLPATLSPSASYRASRRPRLAYMPEWGACYTPAPPPQEMPRALYVGDHSPDLDRQSFMDAVASAPDMTEAQKQTWLSQQDS